MLDRGAALPSESADAAVPGTVLWETGEIQYVRTWRDTSDGSRREYLAARPALDQPSLATIGRLDHEHGLSEHLDPSWALRPLELVRERGQTMLLFDPVSAVPFDRAIDPRSPIETFLRAAIASASALEHLHQHEIVHRDIKAPNILIEEGGSRARLTGFGIASRLPRERKAPQTPERIAGTLSHMAPEQTGRMNRSVDSRSDLYSLGVTFYRALTGELPFVASEPIEWVHCHIARSPVAPIARVAAIPAQLSAIVMKLLAKTPEDRYQTAASVERDLRRCLDDWTTRGRIHEFALAEGDRAARLLVPERLYGRDEQIATLLGAFDEVIASGRPRLVLVSGHAGVGKSSLVGELHKAVVAPRGLFASGKFDQLRRDIPYATLAQAFQRLLRQLLGKPGSELARWRMHLLQALEPNAALLFDLIPELRFVVGEQPAVVEVPSAAAEIRFQDTLLRLIGVFARAEHPLALFLDDLQWLDGATLALLERLILEPAQHLLLVAAYRDNEVDAAHPLMKTLSAVHESKSSAKELVLEPLTREDLMYWLADALDAEPEAVAPLSQLVHDKTGGNPFFTHQFLQELFDDSLITFDPTRRHWHWALERIRAKGYTDNVVDLMVGKLGRLPPSQQTAIEGLACLGSVAHKSMLSLTVGVSEEEIDGALWEALRQELIVRDEDAYRFAHDRVQEAAYSLIPESERPPRHLRIGRLLMARLSPEQREEATFEIAGHFNRALDLAMSVLSDDEREEVAALNLAAGKRAKGATAYASALHYLVAAVAFISSGGWRRRTLRFDIELGRAECEFLTGKIAAAEERLRVLSSRAADPTERAKVASVQADVYVALDRPDQALAEIAAAFELAGIQIRLGTPESDAREVYERTCAKVDGIGIDQVAALPPMTDPAARAALDLAVAAQAPAAMVDKSFEVLNVCAAIDLVLEHGLHDAACSALSHLGYLAAWHFGDFKQALRLGELGYGLIERTPFRRYEGIAVHGFATLIMQWARPFRSCRPLFQRVFEVARANGERYNQASNATQWITNLFFGGDPLALVDREIEAALVLCQTAAFPMYIVTVRTRAALVRNLRGLTHRFGSLDDEHFNESRTEDYLANELRIPPIECWYWICNLQARFHAGDYVAAVKASCKAQRHIETTRGALPRVEHELYSGLSRAALCGSAAGDDAREHLDMLCAHQRQLAAWAEHCPENFESIATLLAAEMARIEGRDSDAARRYEAAICSARDNGLIHVEALALEITGRFYADRGLARTATAILRDARLRYREWGADGKVRQLDERYPELEDDGSRLRATQTSTPAEQLDLTAVLEVSQAVQGETDLERLIRVIMRLSLEHAGAERGLLILPQGDAYRIEAEAKVADGRVGVELRETPIEAADLPQSVLHYVLRTRERVLLQDAQGTSAFSDDRYLRHHRVRSMLCLPLVKQARLVGLIYLENNLAAGAFTPARMSLLEVLASDAAISLENARLYHELQQREARVRRLVDSNIIGIFIWRDDGRVLDTNDAFLRILGYERDDFVSGRVRWPAFVSPGWRDGASSAVSEPGMLWLGRASECEYVRKDGSSVPVLVGGALFDDARDEGVSFVLDLTEVKRTEQALRAGEQRYHELQLRLTEANRIASLGELSASIAHEINQPLSGILTNAGTCLRILTAAQPNLELAGETVRRTLRDVNRASGVITRLRALFAKGETVAEPFDLADVAREMLVLADADLKRASVVVQTELPEAACVVNGDRVQIEQVILNLLRNAMDAMRHVHDRKRTLTIRVGRETVDRVCFSVVDSGIGIGSSDPERLFDPFHTTKKTGMGIGLSVSRSIIERHHGRLWAAPNAGPGMIFSFTLPI